MTKEPPLASASSSPGTVSGSMGGAGSGALRRDGGRVSSVDELEEIGTVLQVLELTQYPNIAGGQVVVMPRHRVRRTRLVSEPSPHVPLAAVAVEPVEEPQVGKEDAAMRVQHAELVSAFKKLLEVSALHKERFEA
ncbi:unnamed protein product, partial [Polarella glacialis]